MNIISFNTNSIRMRIHQLEALIETHAPDFIGIQETKVNDPDFPIDEIRSLGYEAVFHGQKTHYGVAILTKHKILDVQKGFKAEPEDAQRRFIAIRCESPLGGEITVINGYFPQGENISHETKYPNKRAYYANLQDYLEADFGIEDDVIVMGDMNISHTDLDIGIGEDNRKRWLRSGKCSFQLEEREWLNRLLSWGLKDTYRELHPESNELYSWFDYRSKGFDREPKRGLRIDLILASESLMEKCSSAGIDYQVRAMDKPSDHAPIWANFS